MRRVLILNESDFIEGKESLANMKLKVQNLEKEFDDVFFIKNCKIECFKARNARTGNYSQEDFEKYLLEGFLGDFQNKLNMIDQTTGKD